MVSSSPIWLGTLFMLAGLILLAIAVFTLLNTTSAITDPNTPEPSEQSQTQMWGMTAFWFITGFLVLIVGVVLSRRI